MATRRNVPSGDRIIEKEKNEFTPVPGERSNIAPAVPAHVIFKLLGFTLAMFAGPIGTYFLTVDRVFGGNTTFAGALAAVMANVVLISYVVVAMREDDSEAVDAAEKKEKESRKGI